MWTCWWRCGPDTKARGLAFFGAEIELSDTIGGRKVEMMTRVREAYRKSIEPDLVVEYVEDSTGART